MHRKWALFLIGTLCLAAACASPPEGMGTKAAMSQRDAAIMDVLDRYMGALNALDWAGHVSTYHFPHFRYASGEITIWAEPDEIAPLMNLSGATSEADQRARLRAVLEPDWHQSVWTQRDIVQGDDGKVHVVTRFERQREDGSLIKAYNSLYIMTLVDGEWGIKGRSSFAP